MTLGEIYDFTLSSTLNEFTPFNYFVLDFFFFLLVITSYWIICVKPTIRLYILNRFIILLDEYY